MSIAFGIVVVAMAWAIVFECGAAVGAVLAAFTTNPAAEHYSDVPAGSSQETSDIATSDAHEAELDIVSAASRTS